MVRGIGKKKFLSEFLLRNNYIATAGRIATVQGLGGRAPGPESRGRRHAKYTVDNRLSNRTAYRHGGAPATRGLGRGSSTRP